MDTRKLRTEETEHGYAIYDTDTDNEDRVGFIETTGDSFYDEQERFPLSAEIVKRWNAYPELVSALEALCDLPADDQGDRVIPAGLLDQTRAAIDNA